MRLTRWMLAGLYVLALCGAAVAQNPVKIRVAWVAPVSNWASILLREEADLAKHPRVLHAEPVRFRRYAADDHGACNRRARSRKPRLLTLALGFRMPASMICASSPMNSATARRATTQGIFPLKDGATKKAEDLKGKVVATNAVGSAVDVATRAMLRKSGLEDKRDYTVTRRRFRRCARCWARRSISFRRCRSRSIRIAQDRDAAVPAERRDRRTDDRLTARKRSPTRIAPP